MPLPGTVLQSGSTVLPTSIPATVDAMDPDGVYVIDCGVTLYIYIRKEVNVDTLESLFGVMSYEELMESYQMAYYEDNDWNVRAQAIIQELRDIKNGFYPNLVVVLQGDYNEPML